MTPSASTCIPIAVGRLRGLRLPGPLQRLHEDTAGLITTGFLPQRFRDEMRLPWDQQRQRRFDRLIGALRVVNNAMPGALRQFPFNVLLKDPGLAHPHQSPWSDT